MEIGGNGRDMASPCADGDSIADDESFSNAIPEFDPGKEVTYSDLQLFTDNFCKENLMGRTQFGLLYRGKIPQGWKGGKDYENEKAVAVKMWDTKSIIRPNGVFFDFEPEYILARMKNEIRFLSLPSLESNQVVGKVQGYCFEENKLGVVYDVNPLDTVYNLICDQYKFGWRKRVKVALGLARFLRLCHENTTKYLVRNLSTAHIVVDQDFNPVLVDFAMILGGGIGDDRVPQTYDVPLSSYGYLDNHLINSGVWFDRTDVYVFGIILLELIVKCTSRQVARAVRFDRTIFIYESDELEEVKCFCALKKKRKKKIVKVSFVNSHLRVDPYYDAGDGSELTRLGFDCLAGVPSKRPSMLEIVDKLEKLYVTKNALN